MFHKLTDVDSVNLPRQFTYPFLYVPHPLCLQAKKQVEEYLCQQFQWSQELANGKMFGVLVVKNCENEVGFLAAFSGQLANSYLHEFFVPPIYDLNDSSSFFRREESLISSLNQQIDELQNGDTYRNLKRELETTQIDYLRFLEVWKKKLAEEKAKREQIREGSPSEDVQAKLICQSQYLKAQFKREKKKEEDKQTNLRQKIALTENLILELKEKRKRMSAELQDKLFDQFVISNYKGEKNTLKEIFSPLLPPSGAGECAAPKLLQCAFQNGYEPLCMAEFWVGKSPKSIIRKNGEFYPSCYAKCKPILNYMLQGMNVEPNPMETRIVAQHLDIIWQDDDLVIVNKPSGLLSVKGNLDSISTEEVVQQLFPADMVKAVHRLDQATSGILVFARNEEMYVAMQELFAQRKVKKRYVARLAGLLPNSAGTIDLPLYPDIEHRPCQMVSYEYGKQSVTHYEVIGKDERFTTVYFYPETGRTHQLRVHAAHPLGLNCPIVGDTLYGKADERLYLQAQRIEFIHPKTRKLVVVELPRDF